MEDCFCEKNPLKLRKGKLKTRDKNKTLHILKSELTENNYNLLKNLSKSLAEKFIDAC